MNLETSLQPRLWEVIRNNVESRNFSGAVLDAIHFLSDVIRERSGLEGDGVALIGAAFGGASPKLKVNRLQTESEQNVQRGVESLLRGVFQAIRNPRSHGSYIDDEKDAVVILLFLDYLLRIVDQSRSPFALPSFVGRVLDPDFVPTERYAVLLVKEIPQNKRVLTCRELFARRSEADITKIRVFFKEIFRKMTDDEVFEISEVLSDELRTTDDEETIRFVVGGFGPHVWPRLDEVARLRIENKLIGSVRQGSYLKTQRRCTGGAFGTWTRSIIPHVTLKDELWTAVFDKLGSSDVHEQDYAFTYFTSFIDKNLDAPPAHLKIAVKRGLKKGDLRFKSLAERWKYKDFLELRELNDPWREPFKELLAKFEPAIYLSDDDVPF